VGNLETILEEKERKLETIQEKIGEEVANNWRGERRVSSIQFVTRRRRGSSKQVASTRSRGSGKGVMKRSRVSGK